MAFINDFDERSFSTKQWCPVLQKKIKPVGSRTANWTITNYYNMCISAALVFLQQISRKKASEEIHFLPHKVAASLQVLYG